MSWAMNNPRILIVRKGHVGGGIERASSLMANFFASRDQDVVMLSLYDGKYSYKLDKRIRCVDVEVKSKNRVLRILNTIRLLRKEIIKINPKLILSYGEYMNIPVAIATRGLGVAVILSDRLSPNFSLGKVYNLLKKYSYSYVDGFIAQTEISKQILLKKVKMKNVTVIPNPVNTIERVTCEKKNYIVTVGRLSPEKGQRYLLEAFAKLENHDWKLSIVGGYKRQERYDELVTLAKELGISDRVLFHGRCSDFSKELSEAQIFVLPSLLEGYPNALIEAMSLPLPCISSNCVAGPSDIIQHGVNGLLVESGNVQKLYEAMDLLTKDAKLRDKLAEEAYKIRNKLSMNVIGQKYLDYVLSFVK